MHEVSLGGVLVDYLTGEARERTTYEDLRQALARYLVEKRGHSKDSLIPRYPVRYQANGEEHCREADVAVRSPSGELLLLALFCPGQVNTYVREALSMARLALPRPSPLVAVTDMRDAQLLSANDGTVVASGLAVLPSARELEALASAHPIRALAEEQRDKESRILHTYTGFLKTCCNAACPLA